MILAPFDHRLPTRLIFGPGSVDRIAEVVQEIPAQKVLLVTDPGIVSAGHAGRVQDLLKKAGLTVVTFDRARENPTTRCVDECVAVARSQPIEAIIGLGGGSAMDTAKGCNFLLTNGGRMQDYWGLGLAHSPMLPLIAVPTTAGTGSECQSFALIADEETHRKMACGDPKAAARAAILDPLLTLSQPEWVAACAGLDAVSHAVETAVTRKRNALSWMYSRESFRLTAQAFPRVFEEPEDLVARGKMLLGAAFAGVAIENSMLGAAHSAANPLTARFDIVHGHAVALMLPWVVRFNAEDPEVLGSYAELAQAACLVPTCEGPEKALQALVERLAGFVDLAGMLRSLAECGVDSEAIPTLAAEAADQWTAQFNPRTVSVEDFERLYREALAATGDRR